jgi:hypothetical protein
MHQTATCFDTALPSSLNLLEQRGTGSTLHSWNIYIYIYIYMTYDEKIKVFRIYIVDRGLLQGYNPTFFSKDCLTL